MFFEKPWINRLTDGLPVGASILDLGCGAGEPIAGHLICEGYDVTGLDRSSAMLAFFKTRYPQSRAIEADMRSLALGHRFDAILSWDALFHLWPDEQRTTLPRIADHLASPGRLLFTAGDQEGHVTGHVGDETVYHGSLDPEEYRSILERLGFVVEIVLHDESAHDRTIVLALRP